MSGNDPLRDLTDAQRSAVMEKAIELSERASIEDTEAWVAAAAELGIERDVLIAAHRSLEREKVRSAGPQSQEEIVGAAEARNSKRMLWTTLVVFGAILTLVVAHLAGIGGASVGGGETSAGRSGVTSAPALEPVSMQLAGVAGKWSVWSESATLRTGTSEVDGQSAVRLTLDPITDASIANYRTTEIHGDLSSLTTLKLSVWSDGIGNLQPTFRRDKHAQWSVPPVPLSAGPNEVELALSSFRYKERAKKGAPWKSADSRAMVDVELFQLKLGKGVNNPGTTGNLDLVELVLQ